MAFMFLFKTLDVKEQYKQKVSSTWVWCVATKCSMSNFYYQSHWLLLSITLVSCYFIKILRKSKIRLKVDSIGNVCLECKMEKQLLVWTQTEPRKPLGLLLCPFQPFLLSYLHSFVILHWLTEQLSTRHLQLVQLAGSQTNGLYSPPHPQFQALQTYSQTCCCPTTWAPPSSPMVILLGLSLLEQTQRQGPL